MMPLRSSSAAQPTTGAAGHSEKAALQHRDAVALPRHHRRYGDPRNPLPSDWVVALCHDRAPTAPGCQPAVLDRHVYLDPDDNSTYQHMEYRASCHGCDWVGDVVRAEDDATCAAHDHSFPGWRDLPVVAPAGPYQPPTRRAEVLRIVERLYPHGWVERHGPVLVSRAGRCIPGYAPTGGYEMAAGFEQADVVSAVECATQMTLF